MSKRIRRSDIPEKRYVCKEGERILVNEEGVWIVGTAVKDRRNRREK